MVLSPGLTPGAKDLDKLAISPRWAPKLLRIVEQSSYFFATGAKADGERCDLLHKACDDRVELTLRTRIILSSWLLFGSSAQEKDSSLPAVTVGLLALDELL